MLYVGIYGALETIFIIFVEHRKRREYLDVYQIKDKKTSLKFWTNLAEGLIHGFTIAIVVVMTLPNARRTGGKLFPVESLHFGIYFLLLNVSIFRHFVSRVCPKLAIFVLAAVSYVIMLGTPWVITLS